MTALETLRPELTAHVEAVRAIGRRAAESVRDLGVALAAAKGDCRHGEWLPFLAAAGVPERFAQRAIRYSKLLPKSDNLSDLPAPSKLLGEAARPGRYQMSFADECEHFLIGMLAAETAGTQPRGETARCAGLMLAMVEEEMRKRGDSGGRRPVNPRM